MSIWPLHGTTRDQYHAIMQTSLAGWIRKSVTPKDALTTPTRSLQSCSPALTSTIPPPPPLPAPQTRTNPPLDAILPSSQHATTTSPPSRPLDPNLTFSPITPALIPSFKRINALLLPIPYPASFYAEITSDPLTASISLLALYESKAIGGIRCRILAPSTLGQTGDRILYVSTLCVLSPYRGLGVAGELLRQIEEVVRARYGITRVGAHVWVANGEGRQWYAKRGFVEVEVLEGYYPRLEPKGAVVVVKDIVG